MNPDVRNPRCACNGPGCPDCNGSIDLSGVSCGICGKDMTPQNSKLHPEFFVCDDCAPEHVCKDICCNYEVAGPQPATAQAGDPCAAVTGGVEVAGEPAVSHDRGNAPATALRLSGNQVSRGHGVQGDPATAATLGTALAFETAAGIHLGELAAGGQFQGTTIEELVSTVARAERGELR